MRWILIGGHILFIYGNKFRYFVVSIIYTLHLSKGFCLTKDIYIYIYTLRSLAFNGVIFVRLVRFLTGPMYIYFVIM